MLNLVYDISLAFDKDFISMRIFYKKHVYKKHEAEIRQELRNIGRLGLKQ